MALQLCYNRYILTHFHADYPEMVNDAEVLVDTYFSGGLNTEEAIFTVCRT